LTLLLVYSWPGYHTPAVSYCVPKHQQVLTKTAVSSGRLAKVSLSALCISSALPSKKRPQPVTSQLSGFKPKVNTHLR
jgi:hypothetical protein